MGHVRQVLAASLVVGLAWGMVAMGQEEKRTLMGSGRRGWRSIAR
jgi:hypothetical protein